jgi:two-component system CheB/CheR fusion protein
MGKYAGIRWPAALRRSHAEAPRLPSAEVLQLLQLWADQALDYALILANVDGLVLGVSRGTLEVLGYTPDDLVGQPLSRIFIPEDLALGLDEHERIVARSAGFSEDDRWLLRKDGTRVWAGGSMRCLRDRHGRCVGFAKVLRDRSDVRMQITTLENRVSALSAVDRRKTVFLNLLAHELASPLQALSNALALLGNRRLAETDAKLVASGSHQAALMRQLVQDLRDIGGIEAGKLDLRMQRVSVHRALLQSEEAARARAESHRLHLQVLLPPGQIEIMADPVRLQQIVMNLLTNAIKYTPRGGHIWLKASVEDRHAVIRVEDDGIGIAAGMLPRLFDLFTQDSESLHLAAGGIGMGLSLVKRLAEQQGGSVEVRSEGRGKGSHFAVRFPHL